MCALCPFANSHRESWLRDSQLSNKDIRRRPPAPDADRDRPAPAESLPIPNPEGSDFSTRRNDR